MPKNPEDFIDWSVTPIQKQPDPLSEPVKKAKGEQSIVDQFADLVRKTVKAPDPGPQMRQATKEDELKMVKAMFPGLPETDEDLQKQEDEWIDGENPIAKWHKEAAKPVEKAPLRKGDLGRGAVDPEMSDEEKRKLMTDEEWRIHKIPVSSE